MGTYRERVLDMEAPSPSPTGGAADVYFYGWYKGAGAAARIAAEADARIAELEAECARLRDTIQTLRGAIPDPDDLGFIADTLAGSDVYSDSFLTARRHEMAQSLATKAARIRLQGGTP